MSTFTDIADQGSKALSATFFQNATDIASLKAGVVAGLKQSLSVSNGMDMNGQSLTLGL